MNKRRLLKLAALLEKDANNKKGVRFDLGTWGAPADPLGNLAGFCFDKRPRKVMATCNTVACAMGLAAISGAFKKEGLRASFDKGTLSDGYVLHPKFKRKTDYEAAAALFDISGDLALRLFSPNSYHHTEGARAEREVAKRIRKLVAADR